MNKAITEGLALMPPPFSAGLNLWSRENGQPGDGSYLSQPNAAFVPSDQDFDGCLELEKTATTQKLRCFQEIPFQPGLYLQVTIKIKAMSGPFPDVRIAGFAGSSSGSNVSSADQTGPSTTLTSYGEVVTIKAIIGSGDRTGVDMVWGTAPVYGHFGLDLTGPNGGVVRIEDVVIEDVSAIFHSVMFDWVDVKDFGAVGDGVTDDHAAFEAADAAADGKRVIVPPGSYKIDDHLTLNNPVQFEGQLLMADSDRLILVHGYDLESYTTAFGGELAGFRKALQALFYYTDHVELDLKGRRVELDGPIDVAALAGLTTFTTRRVICNGQLSALNSSDWDNTQMTSVATYSTANSAKLTAVANISAVPVGARVSGAGVGREVYVISKNVGTSTLTLSNPLVGGNGTRTYTFTRYKYLLDFSGFSSMSKMEISNCELLCNGYASAINLPTSGEGFRITDCLFNKPKDRAVTSSGFGCQDLTLDRNNFISNEQGLPAQNRTSIVFNVNANDSKIRNNRASRFAHFAVFAGTGHIILGNHFFGGDEDEAGIRRAGLVLTTPSAKSFVTGNYIDNHFIEMTNEHDDEPDLTTAFSFGGLTVTGNIFVAMNMAPWFRWIVITPRGTGHYVNGLSVTSNVFRAVNGTVDRVDLVDETYAALNYTAFRNVIFEHNVFNGINQETASPLLVEHTQNTAADTWVVDGSAYLPFAARARNVMSVVAEGAITNSSNVAQFVTNYVQVEQGTNHNLINVKWPSAVKGKVQVVLRCDNPV
jgi:hypothetical protein